MRTWNVVLGAGVLAAATAVLLLGGALSGPPRGSALAVGRGQAPGTDDGSVASLLAGFASGDTVRLVRELEARALTDPGSGSVLAALALAYQQRARETADPSFYELSARALARAAAAGGPEDVIVQGRASLANTRHRFSDGLRLSRRAVHLDPEDGAAYGALGDALLGLGRYRKAFAAYDRMAKLSPGIPSYARVAHARALLGRTEAAAEAYELALEAGPLVPEYVAWTRVQLGNLYFEAGALARAERAFRQAQRALPGYVHAEAAFARVDAARGRYARAARQLSAVVDALPVPAYAIQFADVLHAAGRTAEAKRAEELVGALQRLLDANGVRTELQTALFDLDRNRSVRDALRGARLAQASAPSIQAEDVLAWGLFKAGRCAQARAHSTRALRLGTKNALAYFHRGLIERCLGSSSWRWWLERALETNPRFSIRFAPLARHVLAGAS